MAFAFGGLNVASTKKSLAAELIQNIVQIEHLDNRYPYVLVLLDEYYHPEKLKKITTFLEHNGIYNFRAVTALNCIILKEDLKGELSKFYRINQSKWKQYASEAIGVVAVGAALYAINQSADLQTSFFYDIVFNKSCFWSPDAQTWVYPIDTFQEIFAAIQSKNNDNMYHISSGPADTYKTHFAEYQLKQIISKIPKPFVKTKLTQMTYSEFKKIKT
jgi:hypothetical protein